MTGEIYHYKKYIFSWFDSPAYLFSKENQLFFRVKAIFLIWFPSKKISIRISQDITHIFSSLSVYYIGACFWNWKYWKFFFYLKFYHVMCIALLQCLCTISVLEWVLDILQTYFDEKKIRNCAVYNSLTQFFDKQSCMSIFPSNFLEWHQKSVES